MVLGSGKYEIIKHSNAGDVRWTVETPADGEPIDFYNLYWDAEARKLFSYDRFGLWEYQAAVGVPLTYQLRVDNGYVAGERWGECLNIQNIIESIEKYI